MIYLVFSESNLTSLAGNRFQDQGPRRGCSQLMEKQMENVFVLTTNGKLPLAMILV